MSTSCLLLVGCGIIGLAGDEGQHVWTIEELAKGLRARDQALKSYSFDAQLQIRMRSDHTGKMLDYATASHIEVDRTTGRFFIHNLGQFPQPPAPMLGKKEDWFATEDVLIAFDGERTKRMSQSTGVELGTGKETKTLIKGGQVIRGRRPSWVIDPEQYVGMFQGKSVADRLTSKPFRIVPSDDPNIVMAECDFGVTQNDPDQTRFRGRFWIDVTKNMAVQRIESATKQGTFSSWRPFVNAIVEKWVEVEGFWLPSRYHYEFYTVPIDADYHLVKGTTATLTHWSVNQEIPPSKFKIAFEPETTVSDTDRGTVYQTGKITDPKVAEAAREATALRSRFEEAQASIRERPEEVSGRWLWVVWAVIGLVVLVAAWRLRRRVAGGRTSKEVSA